MHNGYTLDPQICVYVVSGFVGQSSHQEHGLEDVSPTQQKATGNKQLITEMSKSWNGMYRKVPKFFDIRKLCCNLPKIKSRGQTIGYFFKKMQI